jgi:Ca2+-binding RTX toxin-like protein
MANFASLTGGDDTYVGTDNNDTILGGGGGDTIYALDGNDSLDGGAGNDLLYAGSGKDLVFAGADNDTVYGQAAHDTLYGGTGNDFLDGGNTEDELYGEGGNDTLIGGNQDDTLVGGAGDDVMNGDGFSQQSGNAPGDGGTGTSSGNQDVFYFDNGFGDDVILSFELGKDVLQIESGINGTGVTDVSQLSGLITEVGGNAVISLGSDSITLVGVTKDQLIANLNDAVDIV